MKRVLVTGGAGFIGSHLCRRLISDGSKVTCLDNLYTGSLQNIESLLQHPNFKYIDHDISEPIYLEVDQIYNLACPASPIHYQKDPIQTTKTIVMGAVHMLELANKVDADILQASTSEIYGDPAISPQSETYWGNVNPIGIRACYDEGKRCAETLFFNYRRQYNLNIKVARIFNTYGPNMSKNDGRVVSNFIVQALKNEPITIYGTGMQTRSFCFINDMICALVLLMNTPRTFSGPINLGNPAEVTIADLAGLIINMTKSYSEIASCPLPEDDPRQRKPDIAVARQILKWSPKVNIAVGLTTTIDYFKNILSNSHWKSQTIKNNHFSVDSTESTFH